MCNFEQCERKLAWKKCLMLLLQDKVKLKYWSVAVCWQVCIVCVSITLPLPFYSLTCMIVCFSQANRGSHRSCNRDKQVVRQMRQTEFDGWLYYLYYIHKHARVNGDLNIGMRNQNF